MAWLKQRRGASPHPQFSAPSDSRCRRSGCPDVPMADCEYVDRDGVACATSWCYEHLDIVAKRPYCVRHGRVIAVLSASATAAHRPAVGNRAASLASWVADAIDSGVRSALADIAEDSDRVVSDPIDFVPATGSTARDLWRRSWRLVSRERPRTVILDVDEANDAEIRVAVDGVPVMAAVPSWIVERRAGTPLSDPDTFYSDVLARLRAALG